MWPARAGPQEADAFREGACAETVVASARCRRDREGTTAAIAGEVNFGAQPDAGPAQGLIVQFVLPVPSHFFVR